MHPDNDDTLYPIHPPDPEQAEHSQNAEHSLAQAPLQLYSIRYAFHLAHVSRRFQHRLFHM